jgi:hypothetical protein
MASPVECSGILHRYGCLTYIGLAQRTAKSDAHMSLCPTLATLHCNAEPRLLHHLSVHRRYRNLPTHQAAAPAGAFVNQSTSTFFYHFSFVSRTHQSSPHHFNKAQHLLVNIRHRLSVPFIAFHFSKEARAHGVYVRC